MKKMFLFMLCVLCSCTLIACGKEDSKQTNNSNVENNNQSEVLKEYDEPIVIKDMKTLEEEIDFLIECGNTFKEEYAYRQAVYFYSMGAAHVTSLRYLVDNILWLKGEGETIADLSKERVADWYEIAALNYVSPFPLYAQYLLMKMQGKSEEANTFLTQAQKNPDCPENDLFYNWKEKSVDDLYELKEDLEKLEDKLFAIYQPNVTPLEVLCGSEYLQEFHLVLTQVCIELDDAEAALACAERAINVNPFTGTGYAYGALASIAENNVQVAMDYLNEGFAVEPTSPSVNIVMAIVAKAEGDTEKMNLHLDIAKQGELTEQMISLVQALEGN